MSFADLTELKSAIQNPNTGFVNIDSMATVAGRPYDCWVFGRPAGVAPTTAVVPTKDTVGALADLPPVSGERRLIGARFNALNPGNYIIADRLSHQGGLVGNVATVQTTNLPTAALTRYTDGVGVMVALTIYTAIGSTASTVTVSYTNQAGISGRVTTAVVIGSTGFNAAGRMIMLPLQGTDYGVRSVESVTLAATTGTAGAFGVTLFKPLVHVAVESVNGIANVGYISGGFLGGLPQVLDNACLSAIAITASSANAMCSGAILMADS